MQGIALHRRVVWTALASAVCVFLSSEAGAATARVRWLPSGNAVISRYDIYVRDAGMTHTGSPAWSGNPAPAADGALEALVTFTPASSGANYFAVVAVSGTTESS